MLDVKLKRGPQVVLPKDAALIAGFTGLGAGDKVIDTGAGSGWLSVFLGNIVGKDGKVTAYEKREEFADIARKNVRKAGLDGIVEIKVKDAALGFDETGVNLVTLDCADSDLLVPNAFAALKKGGWCVGYVPHVEQARKFVLAGEAQGFTHMRTVECIVRDWLIRERGCRPENTGLTHTGFLSFLRKP